MNNYKKYVIETILFGLIGLLGIIGLIYFIINNNLFLVIISFLITYVCFDNFFCGLRANKAGKKVKSHYTIPSFLKK